MRGGCQHAVARTRGPRGPLAARRGLRASWAGGRTVHGPAFIASTGWVGCGLRYRAAYGGFGGLLRVGAGSDALSGSKARARVLRRISCRAAAFRGVSVARGGLGRVGSGRTPFLARPSQAA